MDRIYNSQAINQGYLIEENYKNHTCQYTELRKNDVYNFSRKMKKNSSLQNFEKDSSEVLRENICELWQTKYIQNGIPEQNQNVAQQNCIYAMQFDQYGEKLAFSTQDHQIKIWGVLNQKQLGILQGHNEIVTCIVWFQGKEENELLATCSLDKTIKVWKGEECIDSLEEHQDWLRCLSLSQDNTKMLSGCVGSNVYYWDLEKKKVLYRIKHNRNQENINTINALGFKSNSSEFFVGTRDSIIQIYDVRDTYKPTLKFYSHRKKLNSACFSENQYNILTSGRDSSLRLWDIRYIPTFNESDLSEVKGYVQEYTQHRCEGYNIPALFMNNEESIITGSEDNRIIIYNTSNGEIETQYFVNNQIVHIVQPRCASSKFEFAYSCTQDSDIYFCGPCLISESIKKEKENQKKRKAKSKKGDKNVNEFQQLMQDHGDFILSIFHKNNFTYSQPLSWASVLTMALRDEENQQQSFQIIKKIMNTLIKNQMCFDEEEFDTTETEENKENDETHKSQQHLYHLLEDEFECTGYGNQNNNFYQSCDICMKNQQKLKQIKSQFKQILQKPSNDYLLNMYISNS
ncbi:hypothetical protein ABPG72_019527 [Tetrahymena utriculariae]